jgi:cell wall-associated NlpC family hydrolase
MVYGEQQVGDAWYYLEAGSGARAENKFVYLDGDYLANGPKTVYYGSDGKMVYGEQQVGSNWYYLEPGSGARAESTYVYLDGAYLANGPKIVYYGSDGAMYHGSHVIDGYTRWFDLGSGATDKIGWQNPIGYFQVSTNSVVLSAAAYASSYSFLKYVTPSAIAIDATRDDCVEAFINRAYDYVGTPYAWDYAAAPGVGVDCAGLVMQALYATGMDLGDYNPYAHYTDSYHDHDANNMRADSRFVEVSLADRQRGDLVFWSGHVGIYLGNDQIIDAYPPQVAVRSLWSYGTPVAVKRVFI